MTTVKLRKHRIPFSESNVQEILSLINELFKFRPKKGLTRPRWLVVAHLANGKAAAIESGWYGPPEEPGQDEAWTAELRAIADRILTEFQPGDGKF